MKSKKKKAQERVNSNNSIDHSMLRRMYPNLYDLDPQIAEDLRRWEPPQQTPPYRDVFGLPAQIVYRDVRIRSKKGRRASKTRLRLQFQTPDRVMVCLRRSVRRGVLFALSKSGAGAVAKNYYRGKKLMKKLGERPKHWTPKSRISC